MRLYTEEQVLNAIKLAHSRIKPLQYVVDTLKPIELPSDEEIENYARQSGLTHQFVSRGAKWVRNKILEDKQ